MELPETVKLPTQIVSIHTSANPRACSAGFTPVSFKERAHIGGTRDKSDGTYFWPRRTNGVGQPLDASEGNYNKYTIPFFNKNIKI